MMEEVSEEELKETPHSFHKDKISGQDDWIIEFFSTTYDTIGPEFLYLFDESQVNGPLHHPLNTTFLALIPKKDNLDILEYFKPIFLCNITYKVVAKVISQILEKVLSNIISPEQFVFLENRQIDEAIRVA